MKIETQITFKDHLRANYYFSFTRPIMIFFCLLAIVFAIMITIDAGKQIHTSTTGFLLGLLFIVYVCLLMPLMVYIQTKRHYRSNKNLHKPITYEFSDYGIKLNSEDLHSDFLWANVYQVKESKNLFYIYQSKSVANIIPKRFFSGQEIMEFRELIKRTGVKSKLRKG